MIQLHSQNVTVAQNAVYPLNVVDNNINGNCALAGNSIQILETGVYEIIAVFAVEPATAGVVGAQLNVNGVARTGTAVSITGATDTISSFALIDTISVNDEYNINGVLRPPVPITIENTGASDITGSVNVIVKRVSV